MIAWERLIGALPHVTLLNWTSRHIRDIVCDSRQVKPGDLFVAIPGVSVDGHRFVPDALRAGACAIVVERLVPGLEGVSTAVVPNTREALAYLHAAMNGFPGRRLKVIGVTGTDGKTTTVRLIAGILSTAGKAVGRIDSVSAAIGDQEYDTGFHTTTPDAPEMQAYLARMVAAGVEYAVLESTSHGLAQHRVTACEYDIAVVTNITHDHLDFHGTYVAYRDAKALLFRSLNTSARKPDVAKVAVLNADDSAYDYLRAIPVDLQLTYGIDQPALVTASDVRASHNGLDMRIDVAGLQLEVTSPLVGRYNAHNILAAFCVAYSQGVALDVIATGISRVYGVPGRMERIDRGQPFAVILDFAHTANALENALRAVRELTDRQVTVVFGCAGLRDRAKRPWMGEIACRLADKTILTAEDPRTEPLDAIMEEIAAGCRRAGGIEGQDFWRIADRGDAIAEALAGAEPGDVVIVTGKGHEQSMCFGNTEYAWSDRQAICDALAALGYR